MGFGSSPNLRSISSAYGKGKPDGMHELRGVRISPGARAPGYSVNLGFFRNVSKYVPPPPSPPAYLGCFSGDTSIKLENGNVINMEDVIIGDVLEGGVTVNATLQIRNIHKIPFYKVLNSEFNQYIYVTGSHMIKEGAKFVNVMDSSKAEVSTVIHDLFICLITDTHTIQIGENTFWDWSDTCDVCDTLTLPAT
jgi:hypothetical protein